VPVPAGQQPAFAGFRVTLSALDLGHNPVELDLVHLWPLVHVGARISHLDPLSEGHRFGTELVLDGAFDLDATGSAATLALVQEQSDVSHPQSLVHVSVLADDQRRFTSQLQRQLLHVGLCAHRNDLLSYHSRAGKGDLVYFGVSSDGLSCFDPSVDDVYRAWGESGLVEQLAHHQARQRCLF